MGFLVEVGGGLRLPADTTQDGRDSRPSWYQAQPGLKLKAPDLRRKGLWRTQGRRGGAARGL
jgi:hypothetical protein